jgi:hypothetical protein
MAVERQRQKATMSRRGVTFLIFLPSFVLASMVYQALASTQFLAVLAVLAVNLVGATLVVAVDERLSRKAQHGEAQDRPVW